jgi:hypothetical protein
MSLSKAIGAGRGAAWRRPPNGIDGEKPVPKVNRLASLGLLASWTWMGARLVILFSSKRASRSLFRPGLGSAGGALAGILSGAGSTRLANAIGACRLGSIF